MSILEAISPTSKQLLSTPVPKDPPHPEIELVAGKIIDEYRKQFRFFANKPEDYLQDIIVAAGEVAQHADFSIRVGAEVNRAAAVMVLQERQTTLTTRGAK